MSRQVDIDNLSADDALYLQDRPNLIREAQLQGVPDIEDRIREALDPDPAPEVKPASDDPDEPAVERNYEALTLGDARRLAQSRGLSPEGSKKALIARLEASDVTTVSREAEQASSVAGDDEEASE